MSLLQSLRQACARGSCGWLGSLGCLAEQHLITPVWHNGAQLDAHPATGAQSGTGCNQGGAKAAPAVRRPGPCHVQGGRGGCHEGLRLGQSARSCCQHPGSAARLSCQGRNQHCTYMSLHAQQCLGGTACGCLVKRPAENHSSGVRQAWFRDSRCQILKSRFSTATGVSTRGGGLAQRRGWPQHSTRRRWRWSFGMRWRDRAFGRHSSPVVQSGRGQRRQRSHVQSWSRQRMQDGRATSERGEVDGQ